MRGFNSFVLAGLLTIGVGTGALAATGSTTSRGAAPIARDEPSTSPRAATSSAAGFARWAFAEAPVPAGSKLTSSVPALLDQAMSRPGISGLMDLHRVYSSPDPPVAVMAVVLIRLPKGAKITATGSFGGNGGSGSGFVVSLPTSGPHEYLAQLVYSMVRRGGGSTIRIDAQSVWVPDRPAIETIPGSATVQLTGYAAISVARPSSGAVAVHLDASKSARLISALNRLSGAPPPNCMEDAVLYTIVLRVLHGAQYKVVGAECAATVEIALNGHRFAPLHDVGCSVLRLVSEYVSRQASGTRQAAARCRVIA